MAFKGPLSVRKALAIGCATLTLAVAGGLALGQSAEAGDAQFRAELRDVRGHSVGTVKLRISRHDMRVDARLWPNKYVAAGQFHGFHVHANNDPANGVGCVADPSALASTWFVSADGHLSASGQSHGSHNGDLPSPLVLRDGTARISFTTDRIDPAALRGTAVILHAKPDNFGNIPVGTETNQYQPNSPAASDLTARTGNASDRVACGLVRRSR
jgi:Cu-Zn family superoxide dismutase